MEKNTRTSCSLINFWGCLVFSFFIMCACSLLLKYLPPLNILYIHNMFTLHCTPHLIFGNLGSRFIFGSKKLNYASYLAARWWSLRVVMSIFNRFFDDRLNRVSQNWFFYDFLKFNFDWSIVLKSKNRSLIPHKRFGTKFNFEQLSFDAFFEIMLIFGSVEP